MFPRMILVNIALFMERITVTGKEALAWAETYQIVVTAINSQDSIRVAVEGDL